MAASILCLAAFASSALAAAEPAITAAAQLLPRQSGVDPALVGYIRASSGCKKTTAVTRVWQTDALQTTMAAPATTRKQCPPPAPTLNAVP